MAITNLLCQSSLVSNVLISMFVPFSGEIGSHMGVFWLCSADSWVQRPKGKADLARTAYGLGEGGRRRNRAGRQVERAEVGNRQAREQPSLGWEMEAGSGLWAKS